MRLYDSRSGGPLHTGAVIAITASEVAVYNVASVTSAAFGWMSAKPCGVNDTSSLLNTSPYETTANIGTVAPGSGGQVCFGVSMPTHLIVDQFGTFVVV